MANSEPKTFEAPDGRGSYCKSCKFCNKGIGWCEMFDTVVSVKHDFCSIGIRKEKDNEN